MIGSFEIIAIYWHKVNSILKFQFNFQICMFYCNLLKYFGSMICTEVYLNQLMLSIQSISLMVCGNTVDAFLICRHIWLLTSWIYMEKNKNICILIAINLFSIHSF